MRGSKDIARRLRLRGFPGRDSFRRHYPVAAAVAVVAGVGGWLLLRQLEGPRQFLPRPVSASHALFGDKCETCHDAFQVVADAACQQCHSLRRHAADEVDTPRCAHCHVEHRPTDVFLSVSAQACVSCHGDLKTSGKDPQIETKIGTFAAHPEFAALRDGKRDHDPAMLRFNHQVHLTSSQIPDSERPLSCASCHRLGADGRRVQPIRYATDCQRCHTQFVDGPVASLAALHAPPEAIREDLRRQLIDAAAPIWTAASEDLRRKSAAVVVPSPELLVPQPPLPGRAPRPPFAVERFSLAVLEADLYKDYVEPPTKDAQGSDLPADQRQSRNDLNKGCFLCHVEQGRRDAASALPQIAPTAIAERWLSRADFSHRRHAMMPCESCHAHVRDSRETSDTNIPGKAVCQRCHVDGQRESAGTSCMTCHLYHDSSKATAPALAPATLAAVQAAASAPGPACAGNADCAEKAPMPLPSPPRAPIKWWEDVER